MEEPSLKLLPAAFEPLSCAGAAMRFRVLGTLEVVDTSGDALPVGSARLRRLLALLLVHAGTVVSADRIIDVLWRDDPPVNPTNALHNLVSRLRKVIGNGLLARAPGYVLQLSAGETDAGRFEHLMGQARAAATAERPGEAATLLDQALALWGGPAYAEFADEDFARAEAARLDELRVTAMEDRIDAELALGHHAEAAARAETLISAHPLRDRPRAQLMRALYRGGRQADALAVYRDYRDRLDEELGLTPSASLQQLHADILRQEPSLDWAAPPEVAGPPAGNIPAALVGLIGRQRELADLSATLRRARVVTVTGVGGVGKTLLALHTAAADAQRFPGGAWLVELAAISDPSMVADAISTTLGVQQRQGVGVADRLVEYLRPKRVLLVLDNCEHVIDAMARLVDAIVAGCPLVTVLATSREPLGVAEEHVRPLAPLPVPPDGLTDIDTAAAVPAVRLLMDRATAAAPGFTLRPDNLAAVGEICRRLDGLPLAIELAAPKLRAMSPGEVAARLHAPFPLLRSGRRIAAERQQSLWNLVDWSYTLLDDHQRRVFERLSVFAGAFTMAAAWQVCRGAIGDDLEEPEVADIVVSLVDRSMVVAHVADGPDGRTSRYALLETLRAYGRERLVERGEEQAACRAHAQYAVAFAESAESGLEGPDEGRWADAVAEVTGDLRAAHLWAVEHDVDLAARLSAALYMYAETRVVSEMCDWAGRTVRAAEDHGVSHPRLPAVYAAAASGARFRGDLATTAALAERGVAQSRGRSDREAWYARNSLADVALFEGRLIDAERMFTGIATEARAAGDRYVLTLALWNLAFVRAYAGDTEAAVTFAAQARREARLLGSPTLIAWADFSEAEVLLDVQPDRAVALLDEALTLARTVGSRYLIGVALISQASVHARHGDPKRALLLFQDVIVHWHDAGGWTQLWLAMRSIVSLLTRVGADEAAAVLYGALGTSATAGPVFGADAERLAAIVDTLTQRLGPDRLNEATRRGGALHDDEAVAYASAAITEVAAATPRPSSAGATVS
jgi:predicted ATPase/DNA-binding SARP family transcriptional activator